MKTSSLLLLLAVPLSLIAADVKPGDSLDQVRSTLGVPRGQLMIGERLCFYFDRGEIELHRGVVTRVALRSMADQMELDNWRAREAVRVREEQEIRRSRLLVEGEALKTRKLSDPAFLTAPLDYQVAFWEDFSRRYAGVPIAEQLNLARARLLAKVTDDQARADQAQRVAELEVRVAAAESQARESRQRDGFTTNYDSFYRSERDYRYRYSAHGSALAPPSYRFYDSPMPYATSPGMPLLLPNYRVEDVLGSGHQWNEDSLANQTTWSPESREDRQRMARRF